jgi:phosphoribosylformylglycinamidine synthase
MAQPLAYVVYGLGIGCHKEVAHAYEKAGAIVEKPLHYRRLLEEGRDFLFKSQILNFSGGFLHGDMGGAGMYAANELEHSGIHELLVEYAQRGNVIYGQCNGFQVLVKTGLLPGINGDYSRQRVTLGPNACKSYRVDVIQHRLHPVNKDHFAFKGIDDSDFALWCRHGEGNLQFRSRFGTVTEEEAEKNRAAVNARHVLLRYFNPETGKFEYPHNGSIDGIAGLVDETGNIFGHMAHTEVSVYATHYPEWFLQKDDLRRSGIKAEEIDGKALEDIGLEVFRNIVRRFR